MSPSKRARQVPRAHCLAGLKAWKMKKSASMATDDPQNNAEDNNAGSSEGDYTLSLPAVPPTQQPASNTNNASEGGRDDPNDDKEDDNDSDESSNESDASDGNQEEPEKAGMGQFYKAQTPYGKDMVKMFRSFATLPRMMPMPLWFTFVYTARVVSLSFSMSTGRIRSSSGKSTILTGWSCHFLNRTVSSMPHGCAPQALHSLVAKVFHCQEPLCLAF